MGRQKIIQSAADFHAKILDFIKVCETSDSPPTDYALWEYLGITASEFEHLSHGKNKGGEPWEHFERGAKSEEMRKTWEERDKREAEDAVKKLIAYREDRLVKKLEESKNVNGNVIFQLKQTKNGGYQDVQSQDVSATVTVKIDGVGGLEAFR